MSTNSKFHLKMPISLSHPDAETRIDSDSAIVIIGANGAGKTRLGAWFELDSEHKEKVHRISAQKSLNMQPSYSPSLLESAMADLLYGTPAGRHKHKVGSRWGGNPNTFLLNDFDKLMVYLFSEHYEKATKYLSNSQATDIRIIPPETKLDIVKRIWGEVLPHRKLIIGGGKIETQAKEDISTPYNAAEMSDGERVIFYHIGQALSAPENGIIIIDEPELHIHKSIQSILWDKIEAQRSDCLFVYLTHDLDFAASRVGSPKICLTNYHDNSWDWYSVPKNDEIPEEIFLKILGSRKPILFVEGGETSLDTFIYQHLYPDFTITHRGGCEQVISCTRSFSSSKNLHRLNCSGIIDRDQKTDEQVALIENSGVYVLNFSEVENLLLLEDVLRILAAHLLIDDFHSVFNRVKEIVFENLNRNKERLISSLTAAKIEIAFKQFDAKAEGESALTSSVNTLLDAIAVSQLYQESLITVNDILDNKKYLEAIKIYNNKGLLAQISQLFNHTSKGLFEYIQRLISSKDGSAIISAIKAHAPQLPS